MNIENHEHIIILINTSLLYFPLSSDIDITCCAAAAASFNM